MPKRATKKKFSQFGRKTAEIWTIFILSYRRETETKLPTLKIFLESVSKVRTPVKIWAKSVKKWLIPTKMGARILEAWHSCLSGMMHTPIHHPGRTCDRQVPLRVDLPWCSYRLLSISQPARGLGATIACSWQEKDKITRNALDFILDKATTPLS